MSIYRISFLFKIRLASLNNHQYDKITNSNQNIPVELITIWFLNTDLFHKKS
jgi:hypothetical protein